MGITDALLTALGLAMDAFAVAVCKGLSVKRVTVKQYWCIGLWFGGFQALMPTIGYFLGAAFEVYVNAFSHWIAFALLALIGINMVKEGFSKEEESCDDCSFAVKTMLVMAVATSIDALAVGIGYGVRASEGGVAFAIASIGVITFLMSALGLKIGNVFGTKYKSRAEIAGGVILILMGVKILLEHFGVIG